MFRRDRFWIAGCIALIAAAAVVYFREPLFGPVSFLAGDNTTHTLPLHQRLGDRPLPFWNPEMAFGAPVYADATNGWFHPWKIALFAVLPWLVAHDLVYVTSFVITGVAALLLARRLGAPPALSLAAGIAATFAPAVLDNQYNAAYAFALAWSGIGTVAFEIWWERPDGRRIVLLAAGVALVLLAGYPPQLYAWLFYLGLVLIVRLAMERTLVPTRLVGFAGAVALGLGLAAFQVLPLAELSIHSVRQAEVQVLQSFPWASYVAGIFFSNDPTLYRDPKAFVFFFAPLGTALSFLAIAYLPLLRNRRALSHLAAIIICVLAAGGPGGTVFETLRQLLPGIDRLRILSPFVFVTLVPITALFALLLAQAARPSFRWKEIAACVAVVGLLGLALAGSRPSLEATPHYRIVAGSILIATCVVIALLRATARLAWIPAVFAVAIAFEVAALRTDHITYLPDSILLEGRELSAFLAERQHEDPLARAAHLRTRRYDAAFKGLVLQHWKTPGYELYVRTSLRSRMPNLNLMDRIAFAEANDALPLRALPPLRKALQQELREMVPTSPGARVLDRWRVRWIVVQGDLERIPQSAGLTTVWRDPAGGVEVRENPNVLSVVRYEASGDLGVAPVATPAWQRAIDALPWVAPLSIGEVVIEAPAAGRIVAAIPAYPGWNARIDGEHFAPARGSDGSDGSDGSMEFPVVAGSHRIELRFVPYSFHVGVAIAIASACLAGWIYARRPRETLDA